MKVDKKLLVKSILRYPGGKTRAVPQIMELIPDSTKEVLAPFFGGGSVEIALASHGVRVYGYDVFAPLVNFWQAALTEPLIIGTEVRRHHPLSKEDFYSLQKTQMTITNPLISGAAFYVLNRASFSGSTLSGGFSPDHPRFNESSIERLENFAVPNLSVELKSFEESLLLHPEALVYADPPYFIKNYLYGNKGDTHRGFDHAALAELLKKRSLWVLSYNNCPEILDLYKGYKVLHPDWMYGMSKDKNSKEILIISHELAKILKLK